jgi:hypothetical protein
MPKLEWIYQKHDPYISAVRQIIGYMTTVSGVAKGDLPRRADIVRCLETALTHLVNRADCAACASSRGLQDDELSFLSVFEKFAEHSEYRRWINGQKTVVCFSDGQDGERVEDPLRCIAVFLGRKRLDTIGASIHASVRELVDGLFHNLRGG